MYLGKVTGQVVSTVRASGVPHTPWLMVELLDGQGNPTGKAHVAADPLGAGEGELVVLVGGSSARHAVVPEAPVDLTIIGIVDCVTSANAEVYSKKR